ncbi:MAG: hypothetical protein J6T24_01780 [Clostridia bacterium]|nr:hypothetical protein [Clostridia bacterium]
MKTATRILTLILAAVLCLGMLASCGGNGDTTTPAGTTAPGGDSTTAPTVDKWEGVNLSDTTLRIAYNEWISTDIQSTGATNSFPYLIGPDDEALLSRSDYLAAYERHNRVCDKLGLAMGENILYTDIGWNGSTETSLNVIQSFNMADSDDAPHMIIHQNYGMVRGAILGEFYNCKDQSLQNYFDFSNDNWYYDMMLENTLDEDKFYMLMGDYFIDQFRMSYGILVNAEIASAVLTVQGGLDYIYDLVRTGQWTYDAFMEISGYAYTGEQSDELVMGALGSRWWVSRCILSTSGLDVFTRDENGETRYLEGPEIDPIHDMVDMIINMEREDYFSYDWASDSRNTSKANIATTFINGGAFFAMNQMVLALEGNMIQNMDTATGILPFPIYEEDPRGEEAPYEALVSDNANCGGILISADPEMFTAASAFIQMMTEDSDEFFTQYFENGLKYKNNAIGTGHIEMLDIIHDGICSPMSMLYDNYCARSVELTTYTGLMNGSIDAGTNTFSSDWATELGAKITRWEAIKESFGSRTLQ